VLLLLLQATFITLCVLKVAALAVLCYKAYQPFHVVVNNRFVVAARKKAASDNSPTSGRSTSSAGVA
jgi:hypothetical protein